MTARPHHFGFPLRFDAAGRTACSTPEEYLRGLVEMVLFTRPGERVNRPDFGSGVHALVFAGAGDELTQTTRALVHSSLQRWLSDLVRVEDVEVSAEESTLRVTITYVPLGDRTARVMTVTGPGGGS
ncbi:GPW/gp25 family protein [Mycolicibacterium celeriflavum]|uniref:GPW/gp25 family protein n=1 Tax=Mycolicibacterium celeriflavum TaxID=1249101 RepID=UPI003CEAF0BA